MGGPGEGIEFDGCGDDGRIEGGEEEEEAGVGVEERRFLSYPSWFGVRYHLWIGNIPSSSQHFLSLDVQSLCSYFAMDSSSYNTHFSLVGSSTNPPS